MSYQDQHALVLGLGESGLAMARWLSHCGARVHVADTRGEEAVATRLAQLREAVPAVTFTGGQALSAALLENIAVVAVSPGLAPARELAGILPAAQAQGIAVVSEIELFAQALKDLREERAYAPKVLAITGTNGKTTVTSMTGQLCERAGLTVKVAGNISPAVLDVLRDAVAADDLPQVWVLELSSFQLFSTTHLEADAAAVLNVTQDHLDWHGSMQAYADAKARIFGERTVRILNRDDALVMSMAAGTAPVVTFGTSKPVAANDFGIVDEGGMLWLAVAESVVEDSKPSRRRKDQPEQEAEPATIRKLMPAEALRIRGSHNAANALAALALCRALDLPMAQLLHGVREYKGEPHRVEPVGTIADVEYYDDSKGTNVGATVAALNGLGQGGRMNRIVLIAGGDGKGQDFSPLADPVRKYAKAVMLIGRDAGAIRAALADSQVVLENCVTLEEAVSKGAALAQTGDIVLLSPACASMDMFRNYAHRSEVFVEAVREIGLSRGEVMP